MRSSSPKVLWIKGHATEEHFLSSGFTPLIVLGNDTADGLPDGGVLDHFDGLLQIGHYYSAEQHALKQLTLRIHNMFLPRGGQCLRAHQAAKLKALRKLSQGTKHGSTTIPPTFYAHDWSIAQRITLDTLTPTIYHVSLHGSASNKFGY